MATSNKIHLTRDDTGIHTFVSQTDEAAAKASKLLQENHENHHIYFNERGYHNHVAHHLLTLYAIGAPASVIEKHYEANASYQRPMPPAKDQIVEELKNPETFKKYLGDSSHYHDFLCFWQKEIEEKGWENVLQEYVFAGNERADDLLGRLYAGLLHPLIHLGFGIEFHQPAVIAEALAQTAVHNASLTPYLVSIEKASHEIETDKSLPQLLDEIKAEPKLSTTLNSDGIINRMREVIFGQSGKEFTAIAKQWTVPPTEEGLHAKTVEMINNSIYFAAASQNPAKQVRFDFFQMHSVTSSIFFPVFNSLPFVSLADKIRLLKMKVYVDLAVYASAGCAELLMGEVEGYEVRDETWGKIFERLWKLEEDDGHAVKLGRAVAYGEQALKGYEGEGWARIKGDMWGKVGNMAVDSVEGPGPHYVRGVGFNESWRDFAERDAIRQRL